MSEIKAGDRVIHGGRVPGVILMTHLSGVAWFKSDNLAEPYTVRLEKCQPEPPKPIEWIEAIPGVLWYSDDWFIARNAYCFAVRKGLHHTRDWDKLEHAKSYAEAQMREGGR